MQNKMTTKEAKACPKCGQHYHGHPALSRTDNQMLICPDCGIREALASIGLADEEQEHILHLVRQQMEDSKKEREGVE